MAASSPSAAARTQAAIWKLASEGKISPASTRELPLDDWRDAFDSLADRKVIGKAVITP